MNRFATSMIVLGLLAAAGSASAQSDYYGDGDYGDNNGYRQPNVDRYGNSYGAQYDTARVVRVDPVIERYEGPYGDRGNGYATSGNRRCYSRQDGYYAGNGGYDDGGYRDDGYARRGTQAGSNVATVIGGIVGAALGSQVGGGSARYATAAVGTMVGSMAGRQIYDANNRYARGGNGTVTVCDPEPANGGYYRTAEERVSGYDVTYEYAGRRYTTRTDYNPGSTIRVRVDVRPE